MPRAEEPIVAREAGAGTAAILAYHRVATLTPDSHRLCISPTNFRDQLRAVRRRFHPLPLSSLIEAARERRLPKGAVAVTFDDGTLDHLEAASPILCEEQIPATFFVGGDRFDVAIEAWWDTLERVMVNDARLPEHFVLPGVTPPDGLPMRTDRERLEAMRAVHGHVLRSGLSERQELIDRVVRWSGLAAAARASHRPLIADELRRLDTRPGHTIGAHTTNHLFLPAQPRQVQEREINDQKRALEACLGHGVALFAYPYGAASDETAQIARAAGFLAAVTVEGRAMSGADDRFRLPRIEAPQDPDELVTKLDAAFASAGS
jgi:peptidoglycan/xylan/chitin deacetylase (PgdA/CDA1 family)